MKSDDALISFITRFAIGLLCALIDTVTHGEFWAIHLLSCLFPFLAIEPAIFFGKAKFDEMKEKTQQESED